VSRALLILLAALGLGAGGVVASGADFTAHSSSPTTIGAAADFNTVSVSLAAVGTPLTGNVPLSATAASNRGIANVKFQYAPTGTTDWTDVCTDASTPYACPTWNTPAIADGTYDVRALATDNAGYARESVRAARVIDNYTLSVSLDDPGAMSGTEPLTATAANASGGIQYLRIQHRAPGTTTWTTLASCSGTNPRTCNLDTTALPEGNRELRAVVRDYAGHEAQTTPIARAVDNTPPVTTPNIPPTAEGPVTVSAEATDTGSGIASVTFQAYYMGSWTNVCVDTTAPYSCTTDTVAVPDGTYSVRVVTTDNAGVQVIGSTYQIVVDNTPPAGSSITTGNVGTAGRLSNGDWIRLTWTEPIAPASILAGWNGTQQAITVRVRNSGSNDEMHFYSGATQLNLVLSATDLKLGGNFVSNDTVFNANMTQSGSSITVTLSSWVSGTLQTAAAGTITWRPSAAALDLSGKPSSTAMVTEGGAADQDF
jgi:chitinase